MNKFLKKNIIFFLGAFFWKLSAFPIRVLSGEFIAPYVFYDTDKGIDNQIVKKSFAAEGVAVQFEKVPYVRVRLNYSQKEIDCASSTDEDSKLMGAYSVPYIRYKDAAYKLKKSVLPKVESVRDLSHHKVLAFQDARIYLGKEFHWMARSNKEYYEINDQEKQVAYLLDGKTEYAVADKNVFKYYYYQLMSHRKKMKRISFQRMFDEYPVFQDVHYKVVCKNKELTEKFNQGFAKIKKDGSLGAVYNSM